MNAIFTKKITVIIPVFNSERFLNRCYLSLTKQTLSDWEAIFINDGSHDSSLSILEGLAAQDNRIRVINKENGGASSARNVGLKEVRTEYITMLDSDDTLSETALEKMYNAMTISGCDMVTTGLEFHDKTIQRYSVPFCGKLKMTAKLFFRYVHKGPVAKLYKKSIIDRYNIHFPEDMQIAEDRVFIGTYSAHIQDVYNLNEHLYQYRFSENQNSLMHQYGANTLPFKSHIGFCEVPWRIYQHILSQIEDAGIISEWSSECYRETWKAYYNTLPKITHRKQRCLLREAIRKNLVDYKKYVSIGRRIVTSHRYPRLRYIYFIARRIFNFTREIFKKK